LKIRPTRGWVPLNLKEIWEYRELFYFFAWRDIKLRYKQTVLGVAWALIQPVFTMIVFSIFFGKLAKIPSEGIPYPLFVYAALIPWTFFANGLNLASNSLVSNANLVKKVYFPRLIVPVSSVLSGIVDYLISFTVLLAMMLYYGIYPSAEGLLWIPFFMTLTFITAVGVGFWASALNAEYRDIRHVMPFVIQFWLFATPVAYSSNLLEEPWKTLYGLNPMVGVIEGSRWALLQTGELPCCSMIWASALVSLLIFISGAFYFRRMERHLADKV
jgi:lipopolysaccharide transport system permease protein